MATNVSTSRSPIISSDELLAIYRLDEVHVLDTRWYLDGRKGIDSYRSGHIPGAIFVDVETVCTGPGGPSRGRHPLKNPRDFASALASLGVGSGSRIVCYDDQFGSIAARLWWMLDQLSVDVQVLDGGFQAWRGPVEVVDVTFPPNQNPIGTPETWPSEALVSTSEVSRISRSKGAYILDARARERYLGQFEPIDRVPGHIPSAKSFPWTTMIDKDGFLPPYELRQLFSGVLKDTSKPIICSCGSAITACHLLLGLRISGIGDGFLYEGSYSGWSADPRRPICIEEC